MLVPYILLYEYRIGRVSSVCYYTNLVQNKSLHQKIPRVILNTVVTQSHTKHSNANRNRQSIEGEKILEYVKI